MKNLISVILLSFVFISSIYSQNWIHSHYNSTTDKNFRSLRIFSETIDFRRIDYPRLNAAIFFVTNEKRVENDLPALQFNLLLENSSTAHSKRMVRLNFISHADPYNDLLKTPGDRTGFAGVSNPYAAENIATPFAIQYEENETVYPLDDKNNYFSYVPNGKAIPNHTYLSLAESVVELWMNSEGHRQNILNPNALELGCGTFFYREKDSNIPYFMATQNFQLYEKIIEKED